MSLKAPFLLTLLVIMCKLHPFNNWNGGLYGTGM